MFLSTYKKGPRFDCRRLQRLSTPAAESPWPWEVHSKAFVKSVMTGSTTDEVRSMFFEISQYLSRGGFCRAKPRLPAHTHRADCFARDHTMQGFYKKKCQSLPLLI